MLLLINHRNVSKRFLTAVRRLSITVLMSIHACIWNSIDKLKNLGYNGFKW